MAIGTVLRFLYARRLMELLTHLEQFGTSLNRLTSQMICLSSAHSTHMGKGIRRLKLLLIQELVLQERLIDGVLT